MTDNVVFQPENEAAEIDTADDIGLRLKCIRERNGLSQRELAKRAGITNSNISMIEQGLVSPSVNSLARVLGGIPMTLAQFFACNPLDIGQVVYRAEDLAATATTTAKGITRTTLATDKLDRQLTLQKISFLPETDTGRQLLHTDTELSGMVVFGSLELTAGTLVQQLFAGDAFYLTAGQPYRLRNMSAANAEVVITMPSDSKTS